MIVLQILNIDHEILKEIEYIDLKHLARQNKYIKYPKWYHFYLACKDQPIGFKKSNYDRDSELYFWLNIIDK
jgi:hypothetical protein